MFARCLSACVRGVDGFPTEVEVDVRDGNPRFDVVGLADTSAREARDRVRSALVQTGFRFPEGKVLVHLAPAGFPKSGASHDLPIAIGVLVAAGLLPKTVAEGRLLFGELALDGRLRPVPGAFLIASTAARRGLGEVIAPFDNGAESALATDVPVRAPTHLAEAVGCLVGGIQIERARPRRPGDGASATRDFVEVRGQETVKRALVVAAAGGHNVLLVGPPGAGKTLLAERFPDLLPPLDRDEALEVARIRSAAGFPVHGLPRTRPFRAPSCNASLAGLNGGGHPPRPGEITLSHRGVLFLDELPQFRPDALESLRQPLESGSVTVSRATGHMTFPARFQLLTAMNPCPCGFGAPPRCTCTPLAVSRYNARISGPLLDRIDLRIHVPAVPYAALRDNRPGLTTAEMLASVIAAREVQRERFGPGGEPGAGADGGTGPAASPGAGTGSGSFSTARASDAARLNASIRPGELRSHCALAPSSERLLEQAMESGRLSARGVGRVLRVARTVADLAGVRGIADEHVLEAIRWRVG